MLGFMCLINFILNPDGVTVVFGFSITTYLLSTYFLLSHP